MYEDREVVLRRRFCTCDRCGRKMDSDAFDGEWDERVSISFRGGYSSEFGDGNLVEGDFCQHCLKELLGTWLRVTEDDPFSPKAKPANEAIRAYQDYQLREMAHGRTVLRHQFEQYPEVTTKARQVTDRDQCRRAVEAFCGSGLNASQWSQHCSCWDCQYRLWQAAWQCCRDADPALQQQTGQTA